MRRRPLVIVKDMLAGFFADDALTRAAGIAYFALFSAGPILFIATGLAGLVFGRDAVADAIHAEISGMIGREAAETVRELTRRALGESEGGTTLLIGLVTLLFTASGAFGALQSALNAIWKVPADETATMAETLTGFVRAKAAAIGLVGATGFLLVVSLLASAALSAFGTWLGDRAPGLPLLLMLANTALSLAVLTALFAAIYKVLPDRPLAWRDVIVGAAATAVLFTLGKSAIGYYIGSAGVAERFGAAGTVAVVLVWLYYSSAIFLLGAEFTRAWSAKEVADPEVAIARRTLGRPAPDARPPQSAGGRALLIALGAVLLAVRAVQRASRRRQAKTSSETTPSRPQAIT